MTRQFRVSRYVAIAASIVACVAGLAAVGVDYRASGHVDWARIVRALAEPLVALSTFGYIAQMQEQAREKLPPGA